MSVLFTSCAKKTESTTNNLNCSAVLANEGQLSLHLVDDESLFLKDLAKTLPDYLAKEKSGGKAHKIEWFVDPKIGKGVLRAERKEELVSFLKTAKIPADHIVALERSQANLFDSSVDNSPNQVKVTHWSAYYLFKNVELSGAQVSEAFIALDDANYPYINVELTPAGAKTFTEITTKYVNKRLAILYGDQVLTAAMIREPVSGGRIRIDLGSGGTRNEQFQLARKIVCGIKKGSAAP